MSFNYIFYMIHVIIAIILGVIMITFPQLLWKIEYSKNDYHGYSTDFYEISCRIIGVILIICGILAFLNMDIEDGYSYLNDITSLHLVDNFYLSTIEILLLSLLFLFFPHKLCKINSFFYVEGGTPKSSFLIGCRTVGIFGIITSVLLMITNLL